MSASQSFLCAPAYGYDVVVAATQRSINATMKRFLLKVGQSETVICYVVDKHGAPQQIDYEELKNAADKADPFKIPHGADPGANADLAKLIKVRFLFAIKAKIGVPPGYPHDAIPDIVTLGTDANVVTFRLMCSEFQIVEFTPGSIYRDASFMNQSQPLGDAWMFTSTVALRYIPYEPKYGALPQDVQASTQGVSATDFSVQTLLLDLETASLDSIPKISGLDPKSNLCAALQNDFVDTYFADMKKAGYPLLAVTVRHNDLPPSSMPISNVEFEVAPLVGGNGRPLPDPKPEQIGATTLNYLCMTAGHDPRPANAFNWNWLEPADISSFHGAISINRDRFADYLDATLQQLVSRCCYTPLVRLDTDGLKITYNVGLSNTPAPAPTRPAAGSTLLQYRQSATAFDQAGVNGALGQLRLSPSYSMDVSASGNVITFTQRLVVYCVVRSLATEIESNIVDRTLVDTYTLGVDGAGQLVTSLSSTSRDDSQRLHVDNFVDFWTDINQLEDGICNAVQGWTSPALSDIPLALMRGFVFPGGNTFAFKDAAFSDNQDLVAHITYLEPSPPENIAAMIAARKQKLRLAAE